MSKNVDEYLMNLVDVRDEEIRRLQTIIDSLHIQITLLEEHVDIYRSQLLALEDGLTKQSLEKLK